MVENIQLTKDIWLFDYLKSSMAERYPAVKAQQYNLTPELVENAKRLAIEIEQPIIDLWNQPINKTSTYRCDNFIGQDGKKYLGLNTLVGGSTNPLSAHCTLRAGDREPYFNGKEADGKIYKMFCEMIVNNNIPFDKMILEYGTEDCPAWIHLQINKIAGVARKLIYRVGTFTEKKYVLFDLKTWHP